MQFVVDRIRPESYGIGTYLENLKRGRYQIPTFQRDVVWDHNRVKKLWDSIYKFYPLGSVLVWRTDLALQNHRNIGGHELPDAQTDGEYLYILDGQQRTTSLLTSMFGGTIKSQPRRDPKLYVDLSIVSADDTDDESWRNRFLFYAEIDDRGGELLRNVGRKQRHEQGVIPSLFDVAHNYPAVERRLVEGGHAAYDDPVREQLRRVKQMFDSYKLSFIELRGITVGEVCQIFERINQAGQPLSIVDIVVAKTFRVRTYEQDGFYLRGKFEAFREELRRAGSHFCHIDDLTLLQACAIHIRGWVPDSGVHNITDRYLNVLRTDDLEATFPDTARALRDTFDFLENHLRMRGPALVPYRYFYMALSTYFFRNAEPDYALLKRYFWYVALHNDDLLSNTTQLRDHVRRLLAVREGDEFQFERFLLNRERLRRTSYSNRGRLSRAILTLYANQDPRDWALPDRSVLSDVYYRLTDKPNLHHVFPVDFCKNNIPSVGGLADSLMNIAYLTQITNLRISNKNPLEYMRDYLGDGFDTIQQTHLLPADVESWARKGGKPKKTFVNFIEGRIDLVIERIEALIGPIPVHVVDTDELD